MTGGLDPVFVVLARLSIFDNNFYQYQQGYLDEDRYTQIDSENIKVLSPLWKEIGFAQTTQMAEEIDRLNRE